MLPSWDIASRLIRDCFQRLDLLAWFAFGLPLVLSYGSRWLAEVKDTDEPDEPVGPLRLWSAAILAALLMCFASAAIVNPRMTAIHARITVPLEALPQGDPDRSAFDRAHKVSSQLLALRLLLAAGLVAGLAYLPKSQPAESNTAP